MAPAVSLGGARRFDSGPWRFDNPEPWCYMITLVTVIEFLLLLAGVPLFYLGMLLLARWFHTQFYNRK